MSINKVMTPVTELSDPPSYDYTEIRPYLKGSSRKVHVQLSMVN